MKKRILCLLLCLMFSAVILCGCGEKHFEGEICKLEFKPQYTTTLLIPVTIYNGKTTSIILVPYIRTYPDRWYVEVKEFDTEKQNYIYHECYVTEECYNKLNIGDWFVYNKDYCFDSEPYTQHKQ